MRLAFITQDFPPEIGGIQTYAYVLSKAVHSLSNHFILIAPLKKDADKIDSQLPFPVYRIKASNTLLGYKLLTHLKPILQKENIECTFHAQWQTSYSAIKLKNKGIIKKVCVAFHGRELLFNPFEKTPLIKNLYKKYQSFVVSKIDQCYPVSHYTGMLVEQEGVHENKIHVVPNRTNPTLMYPRDATLLKRKLGLINKKILFTGIRHIKGKGLEDVISVIPEVLKSIPNFHYVIGGNGPLTESLQRQVDELQLSNHVTFTGKIPYSEMVLYYNLADLFIMTPTVFEAFGLVYLEANACGIPVIGSRIGGIPDAVIDKKTGFLVTPGNTEEIEKVITLLMNDDTLRLQMGRAGRERVETVANWKVAAAEIFATLG